VIWRLLGILCILGLIGAVYYFSSGSGAPSAPTAAAQPDDAPGYSARDAEVVETGDDGRPLYTLTADRVRQHPNDNRVQLDSPRMTYIARDGVPWHVRARSGQIRGDGELVELYGDVHLNGQTPDAEAPTVIDTSTLSFDTKREVVWTKAPLTLDWNGIKVDAVGVTANLNDHRVRLESRVDGRLPAKSP
jgi:lipopolysaccharide export system protein LptC